MIIGFIGQRNSGKTLSMTIEAYRKYKQGYKIFSNYHLNFPHTLYNVDDLLSYADEGRYFGNAIFLIDELHIWFDSRASGQKRNIIFSYFLNQSSKNDIDIYYTSQFARQVEIRLRMNTEIVVESTAKCFVWEKGQSQPVIKYNYRPKPNDLKIISYITCRMTMFNDTGNDKIKVYTYKGNPFFKLYDTREVIRQQRDVFQRDRDEKLLEKQERQARKNEKKMSTKEIRSEQHANRLWHEQNRLRVMGDI